jgi:hypothetical protein
MSDAMECPDSQEQLLEKLKMMEWEGVKVRREDKEEHVRGRLAPLEESKWEVQGPNGSWTRFKLQHVKRICPRHVEITIGKINDQ